MAAATPYTSGFFATYADTSRQAAFGILPLVIDLVRPQSAVDVGCGTGVWAAALMQLGVADVTGVDGDYVDRKTLEIPPARFLAWDLAKPLRLSRRFDLVMSLEVAEHLPPASAETFVESLTSLGGVVLFSAAIPGQGGTQHVNEQWPEYWAELFARYGFVAVDCIRHRVWNNPAVAGYYAQNALLYVRRDHLSQHPQLAQAAVDKQPPLAIVNPRFFEMRLREARLEGDPSRQSFAVIITRVLPSIGRTILWRIRKRLIAVWTALAKSPHRHAGS